MANHLKLEDFEAWDGHDFIFDFHRLHSGDHLALKDIGYKRIQQYKILLEAFSKMETPKTKNILSDFSKSSYKIQRPACIDLTMSLYTGPQFIIR